MMCVCEMGEGESLGGERWARCEILSVKVRRPNPRSWKVFVATQLVRPFETARLWSTGLVFRGRVLEKSHGSLYLVFWMGRFAQPSFTSGRQLLRCRYSRTW